MEKAVLEYNGLEAKIADWDKRRQELEAQKLAVLQRGSNLVAEQEGLKRELASVVAVRAN